MTKPKPPKGKLKPAKKPKTPKSKLKPPPGKRKRPKTPKDKLKAFDPPAA